MRMLVVVAAAALVGGCTSARRTALIETEVAAFSYEKKVPELMPQVRDLLKEQGFGLREMSEPPMLITEWREEMASSEVAATRYRYLVEFFRVRLSDGNEGAQVRVTKHLIDARGSPDAAAQQANGGGRGEGPGGPSGQSWSGRDGKPYTETKTVPYSQRATLDEAAGTLPGGPSSTKRDLQLEWQVLQRVDPLNAKRLEAYVARQDP